MNYIPNPLSIYILVISMAISMSGMAQDFSRMDIEFIKDGRPLKNALAGGIRAGQFNQIDLDNDGKKDIVAFDRGSGKLLPYINEGDFGEINYRYDPSYIDIFPPLQSWILLRDFNQDGLEDIFTGYINGVRIYKAKRDGNDLSFEVINFNKVPGFPSMLPFPSGSNFTQVTVELTDIPVIEDLDSDGDLDILSFEPAGSYVYYYKNMTEERFLPKDTLVYLLEDRCWGKFFESGVSEDVSLSDNCNDCATFNGKHVQHAGSTLCAFDGDGDGDFDLLVGDLTNEHMVYLNNGGSKDQACIVDQDITFPSYDSPIEMFVFNAAFYLDVNNDGKRDLIATTNNRDGRNFEHIWLYINEGEDDAPIFSLTRRNLFLEDMFSVGSNSSPTFWDYNNDGLLDLLVGSAGRIISGNDKTGALELWINTGSKSVPEFTLLDEDYLSYKSLSNNGTNFSPAVGDIDNDGDIDLFVGDVFGQLYFHKNNAGSGAVPSFDSRTYPYASIFIGQSAKPSIADIDQDGQNDLVIGEGGRNFVNGIYGSLNYFKNFGSDGMENFSDQATSSVLYGFLSGNENGSFFSSAPLYVDHPEGGYYLFIGSDLGNIYLLEDVTNTINGPVTTVSEQLGGLEPGRRSSPAVADLDNDGFLEIIIGTARGGLEAFNTDLPAKGPSNIENLSSKTTIDVFPNPTADYLNFTSNVSPERLRLSDLSGKVLLDIIAPDNKLDLSEFDSGIYLLEMTIDQKRYITKIVKI
jgi:hypothetical protein